jgi:hypothetical protein
MCRWCNLRGLSRGRHTSRNARRVSEVYLKLERNISPPVSNEGERGLARQRRRWALNLIDGCAVPSPTILSYWHTITSMRCATSFPGGPSPLALSPDSHYSPLTCMILPNSAGSSSNLDFIFSKCECRNFDCMSSSSQCYDLGEGVCVVNHWSYLVTLSLSICICGRVVLLCRGLISCRVTAQSFVVGGLALLCAHSVALIVALSSRSCSCLLTSNISCSCTSTCPWSR